MNTQNAARPPSVFWENTAFLTMLLCALGIVVGVYRIFFYDMFLHSGDYYSASESWVADSESNLYDAALVAYKQKDYTRAIAYLNLAGESIHDSSGNLLERKRSFAADIQFLMGNVLVEQKQLEQAKDAYRAALRLNPTHRHAKYNLELLLKPQLGGNGKGQGGGGDGGEGDGDGGGNPMDPQQGDPGTDPNGKGAGGATKKGI